MQTQNFSDFSGGFTDKTIPGQHNRYLAADNLIIEADQKLVIRAGFDILSNTAYQLTPSERVAALVNFDYDSEIIAVQNKKAYYIDAGAWVEATGPVGSIFPQNTAASLVEEAQWNHHVYLVSDSGDLPAKMYRDDVGVMQLRTAGLPKPATPYLYTTDAAKLAAAIALAVDIKTQMQAHVNDYGVAPAAHIAQDLAVYNALNALSTPVTLANLIAYTKVLRTQYNAHVEDARLSEAAQTYHTQISNLAVTALNKIRDPILNQLAATNTPADAQLDTLEETVRVLNDLRNKHNWHVVAPITHGNATQTSPSWGGHLVTTPILNLEEKTPTISPNLETMLRYVNYLKAEFNRHAGSDSTLANGLYFNHINPDNSFLVKMADATDHHTTVGLLANIAFSYAQHIETANGVMGANTAFVKAIYAADQQMRFLFQGTVTLGSAVITSVTPDPTVIGPVVGDLPVGYYITKQTADVTAPFTGWFNDPTLMSFFNQTVVSKTTNSITMSAPAAFSAGVHTFAFHRNNIHSDIETNTTARTSSGQMAVDFLDLWDESATDLAATVAIAKLLADKLKAHETSLVETYTLDDLLLAGFDFGYLKPNYTYYKATFTPASTGEHIAPHTNLNFSGGVSPSYWPELPAMAGEKDGGQGYFEAGLAVKSYLYRFVTSLDYKVGNVDFTDISAPSEPLQVDSVVSPASLTSGDTTWRDAINLSNLPVLVNTANTNYDVTNSKTEIYRTIGDGQVYYKVAEVNNGVTTYSDYIDDTTLLANEAIYTSGGIVANDAPPASSLIHMMEDRMYYVVKNKLYQSLASDPDSVPETFFDVFEEDIVGISSTRSNLVAFSNLNVYRVEGQFDDLGQGFMRHEKIFDRTGLVSQQSIVKADNGIFFAGKDGFYYTDGFQCFRVSDFEDTFVNYTATASQRKAITGAYDNIHKKIFWTIKTQNSYAQPNLIIVMDLQFGIKKEVTPCTTFSGGFDGYTGFNPTTLMFYRNNLHYGDQDGYILYQNPDLYMDLKKDTAVAATSWDKRTVLWDYKSCHEDYGGANFRKYFTRVNVEFEQITNLSVQIKSDADKGRIISSLPIIRSRKLLDWGDPKIDWTSSVYTAQVGGVIDEFRRFRSDGSLRSNYRAIELQNAYCVVVASNIMGNANVTNFAANIWNVTLINSPTYKWPLYSVGYFIRFNGVDYPVVARISDSVVRVSDSGLAPLGVAANVEWEQWGYPKNEKAKLINLDVNFEFMGQQQKDYQGATSTDGGEN